MNGLGAIVLASVLGSLHCVGMCGGLIGFYASGNARQGHQLWAAHGAYHLTRLAAYASLGAVSGQLGTALDLLGRDVGSADLGAVLAGSVMMVWALLLWPRARRGSGLVELRPQARPRLTLRRRLEARLVALARLARERPPIARAALLGLSSALLPCGWLYAFVLLAAGAGSAGRGALLLAGFWVGTVPALLGLGLGIQHLTQRWRAQLPRWSALVLAGLGAYNVLTRWPHSPASAADATTAAVPSCHHAKP